MIFIKRLYAAWSIYLDFCNHFSNVWLLHFWQVDAYEAKNQDLMAENADLKALLRSMQVTLIIVYTMIPNFQQ